MDYRNRNINSGYSILEALKLMDILEKKLLIVIDNNKFTGLLSVGDIQRAIIKNWPLETPIAEILRKSFRFAKTEDTSIEVKKIMLEFRMELFPIVNNDNEIVDIYFWEDLFEENRPLPTKSFNIPIVIMAGGLGTRLRPLTNVLPKPLIPIGKKTILEEIFDSFSVYGCDNFFVSVNYKADLIKFYIDNQGLPFNIDFYAENKPMGTAGSLSLLKGKINQTFFVSNCDILVQQDYSEILQYHNENNNEITVVAALKHFPIAYGTIESGDNGKLLSLVEKPELTYKINSGMYILEPHLIEEIPVNEFFNITQLIQKVILRGGNIGVFPVSEKSWKDIGNWDEYLKVIE